MRIQDVPRNDIPAALAYCRERDWCLTPEEGQMLAMLQDDSADLHTAFERHDVRRREEPEVSE